MREREQEWYEKKQHETQAETFARAHTQNMFHPKWNNSKNIDLAQSGKKMNMEKKMKEKHIYAAVVNEAMYTILMVCYARFGPFEMRLL